MRVLYFAWLKARVGVAEEEVAPPETITDVRGLIAWLSDRDEGHARAFAELGAVRAAVNQTHVGLDHPVEAGDEVAFFPPMTGG
jgi:molybdopterin synthase sulfur carrier subunit